MRACSYQQIKLVKAGVDCRQLPLRVNADLDLRRRRHAAVQQPRVALDRLVADQPRVYAWIGLKLRSGAAGRKQ